MGTKENPSRFDALSKALPNEPIFTLLGRDRSAGNLIREWVKMRQAEGESGDHLMEALSIAADMDKFAMHYHDGTAPVVVTDE